MSLPKPYYNEDGITIYHGDARAILPFISADCLITDPPYGIGCTLGMGGGKKGDGGMWKDVAIAGDDSTLVRDEVLSLVPDMPYVVCASHKQSPPPGANVLLIWDKGEHTGAGDLAFPWKPHFEFIFVRGRGYWYGERRSSIIKINSVAGCVGRANDGMRHHPTEKPEGLMSYFIRRCHGTICDPFMGSGTTLRAAKDLGRKAIGIEIEERYVEIAIKRLQQSVLPLESIKPAEKDDEQLSLS